MQHNEVIQHDSNKIEGGLALGHCVASISNGCHNPLHVLLGLDFHINKNVAI